MNDLKPLFTQLTPGLLSMMRIVAAFLFMAHGSVKLFGMPAAQPTEPVAWLSLIGVGGILEFFGGALLLLGLFTRPVAFILSGLMAVAYFMSHAPKGFWPLINRGELAVLYSFVFLYLTAAGGGSWSLDHWWRRRGNGNAASDEPNAYSKLCPGGRAAEWRQYSHTY
jgi:putative oxidoreductase